MAVGTGVHNLSLVVRAQNRASRALASVSRDLGFLESTRKKVTDGFRTMSNVGVAAIKVLGVAIAAGIGGAIVAYSKFSDAMTGSLAIVEDVSPKQRELLEQTAREVAKTTIFSANEAAEAYFHLFSAGQTVEQSMKTLPTVAAFAQAGLMDLEQATELLVSSQTSLGLSFKDPIKNAEQMARVADVLASADKNALGGIEAFAEALNNRAASAMRTYNIDVEEGVAVLAAWAQQGLKGKTAGEAFSIVTRDLQKAALKEADAWRQVGAAVFDNQGNMRNMADIVEDLENAMRGLSDAEKKQLLMDLGFQERSQQRILQLMGTSDAIRNYEATFRQAGGTVQEVADKQMDSAIKQLGLLGSAIVDFFIGAGKHFDKHFVHLIRGMTEWVNTNSPQWIEAVGEMMEKTLAFGRMLRALYYHFKAVRNGLDPTTDLIRERFGPAIADMVEKIDSAIRWWNELRQPVKDALGEFGKLIPVIFLVAGALKILLVVLGLIASPALLIAAVIAGLIVLFKYLWENSQTFRDIITEVAEFIKGTVVPILEEVWARIQEAAAKFLEWFQADALPWLKELWAQMKETFEAAWEFIVTVWNAAQDIIQVIWENWGDEILAFLKQTWEMLKGIVLGAWKVLEGIFKFFTGLLTGDWKKMWEGLKGIFVGAFTILKSIVVRLWEGLKTIVSGIWDSLKLGWAALWDGFKSVVKGPLNWVLNKLEDFVNGAIDVLNGLINAANKIPGVNISKLNRINIPQLAQGGNIVREGLALVGESGPEIVKLARGAQVIPLAGSPAALSAGGFTVGQVVFMGTPTSMLEDWKRETKLKLMGL